MVGGVSGAVTRTGTPGALLVIGDVVTDVVARHATPLTPATDTAARISTLPGGAGANVACWAAHAGAADVRLMACVGEDSAAWHEEALRRSGVRPVLRTEPDVPTAVVISLVDATAERTLVTDSGAALGLGPKDWNDALLEGVAHLHLSGYLFFADTSRALAQAAMKSARAQGVPVSVDPASAGFIEGFGPGRLLGALSGVDVLLPSLEEARLLAGTREPEEAASVLSRRFPLVVMKLGPDGALLAEGGRTGPRVAAVPAGCVDTTGAGDAFTGAFLATRLSSRDTVDAAEAGCRAGAEAVAVTGGRPEPPGGGPRSGSADRSRSITDLRGEGPGISSSVRPESRNGPPNR
ncbi:carbohydrate kinase family protein [Streptomyces sp. NPDC048639]|uniref:carbohydrate kinase family protein n=1 Tax=Streptomyces sp. NPDC048639 TaxID=3365581 RepID=UPI00371ADB87